MKHVQAIIDEGKAEFGRHPFIRRLEGSGPLEDAVRFFPNLTFFAMAFQDMLRIAEARMEEPSMAEVARRHRIEDADHDQWFLTDLETFGLHPDIRWLFGPETRPPRDTAYQLIAEILHARHDAVRVALVEVLEATGDHFFSRIPGYLERAGYGGPLRYFGRSHHAVEQSHALHDEGHQRMFGDITLTTEERAEAVAAVRRAFAAMTRMVDFFEASIEERRAS